VTTSNGQKPLRWHKKLPNSDPGVAIFDIVKPRRGGGNGPPIALLQPRPRLEEVLGALPLAEAARAGALPHLDRAFVDMTRSGSLYAMSPDRFPLVIFADAGRLYHSVDGADDRKLTLNELTERRAWRNMCMAEGARNMDPRCLVGPKTLGDPGSSQFGKLLGEVPPKSQKPLDRAPATADRPAAPSPPLTLDAILNSQPNASGDRHGHDLKHGHGRGRGHSELKALPPTTEQPSLPAPHRLLTIGAAPDGSIQSLNALVLVGLGFLLAVLWLRRPASFSMPHVGPPGMAKSSSYQAPPVDRAYVQENTHVQPEQSSEPGSPHRSDASIGARPMTPAALETKELPPLPPTPLIDTENQPITPSTPRVQLEVPGDGEDESENENDGSPHKRRRPRRRGKKKRAGTTAKEGSEDGGLPTDADKASASGSADERITGKMLIVPSTPTIKEVKTPSLVVSDEILGKSPPSILGICTDLIYRLRLTRYRRLQRLTSRPRCRSQTSPPRFRHPRLSRSRHPSGLGRPPQCDQILLPRSTRHVPLHRPRALSRLSRRCSRTTRRTPGTRGGFRSQTRAQADHGGVEAFTCAQDCASRHQAAEYIDLGGGEEREREACWA
jgi:serine/threonine-protein kinase/endoribonuclease IRE1